MHWHDYSVDWQASWWSRVPKIPRFTTVRHPAIVDTRKNVQKAPHDVRGFFPIIFVKLTGRYPAQTRTSPAVGTLWVFPYHSHKIPGSRPSYRQRLWGRRH